MRPGEAALPSCAGRATLGALSGRSGPVLLGEDGPETGYGLRQDEHGKRGPCRDNDERHQGADHDWPAFTTEIEV